MNALASVLVIDDDPRMGTFIVGEIKKLGLNGVSVTEVDDFLDSLKDNVEIVVIDLRMPGYDGVELLNRLATLRSNVGIILVSAVEARVLESAAQVADSYGLWLLGVLEKPFLAKDLETLVKAHAIGRPQAKKYAAREARVSRSELQTALQSKELVVHYQPKIKLSNSQVVGLEALVRWQHPTLGLIYPDEFIPLAEESGLIDELGWYVAEYSIRDIADFYAKTGLLLKISINASIRTLSDQSFPDRLVAIASRHNVPTNKIVLEVTETSVIRDVAPTVSVLTRLRLNDFEISIDDFGTGEANLKQLQFIPATELKIDKSFVQNALQKSTADATVRNLVGLGRDLKMTTVAEGVENTDQLRLVENAGCDLVQGYFFSPALPADELVAWMRSR